MTHPRSFRRLAWLPNALTIGRLAALPLVGWAILRADGPTDALAAWLFAAIGITDLLDGFLARRLHAESAFGRLADPLADRLLVAVGLAGLLWLGRFHPAGPLVILGRDVLTIVGVAALRGRGLDVRVDFLGKSSSALVMAAIALGLLSTAHWVDGLFWVSVGLSVIAFGHYVTGIVRGLGATGGTRISSGG